MKKYFLLTIILVNGCLSWSQDYEPYHTTEVPVLDTFYHAYIIEDKFRWLEKVNSEETVEWIKTQNKHSKKYLSKIPRRNKIENLISKYGNTNYSIPGKESKYSFSYAYWNEVSTRVLMYKGPGVFDYKILAQPDDISLSDNILFTGVFPSNDESYMVYLYSRNGGDKMEAKVVNLSNGRHMADHLDDIMFSNIVWYKDGFFYSTYERENEFGVTQGQKVLYHKVGTGQYEDKLIFERKKYPLNDFWFRVSHDNKYFILHEEFQHVEKYNIFYVNLEEGSFQVKPLLVNLKQPIYIIDTHDNKFIASSSLGSGNGMLIEIDPAAPYNLKAITPSYSKAVLESVVLQDSCIAAIYLTDHPILTILDYSGNVKYNLELPNATSAHLRTLGRERDSIYFYYSSYTIPPIVYELDLATYEKKLIKKTSVHFDFNQYELKEIEYTSNDGEMVPMTIVHKKDILLDGNNPTLLEAYGGFGVISAPSFDPGVVYFIEQGGVYAYAHIRGGGYKGKAWADAGKGVHKQQSFDDFISGAEYLVNEKYTSTEKLAITGASNGGLLVATAAIQRPDLFKVVVPNVAALDMLRFEKFTIGSKHQDEYGTIKDSTSFKNLLAYSPYHNIKADVNYPSMLILTSTNDDRVPPFHSYKFTAALQNRPVQTNPILLKVQKQAGHQGAITIKASYDELIDFYGFILMMINSE